MRLAIIDLGTVTSRLLIADVIEGRVHELEWHIRITHLGEGLDETGIIGDEALAREVAACRDFMGAVQASEQRDGKPVERIVAVATSAMRDAANREQVRRELRATGIDVAVIAGEREAELSFLGALSGFAPGYFIDTEPVLSLDVGGGSTEAILGLPKREGGEPHILATRSFDIGCRRIADRFLLSDPPLATEIAGARAWVRHEMRGHFEQFIHAPQAAIAVAGTATTVVSVRDEMADYDPWKVHGSVVTAGELNQVFQKLAALSLKDRKLCTGLEPERAAVILGGLIILQIALELAKLDSFIVSETDILQGMALATWQGSKGF